MPDLDPIDERLSAASRRWQAEQPVPPTVPLDRLDESLPRRGVPWRPLVATAAALLVVVGGASIISGLGGGGTPSPTTDPSTVATSHTTTDRGSGAMVVPWRDLPAGHPDVRRGVDSHVVTPYDRVSATGHISGRAEPLDMLRFVAVLESSTPLPLDPCPDYTIAFGRFAYWTHRLNCAAVPFHDAQGRPVLPAFQNVRFEMRVRVPDVRGEQKVLWTLDGPQQMPGFYGLVHVTAP
jgi:hypothetical protein